MYDQILLYQHSMLLRHVKRRFLFLFWYLFGCFCVRDWNSFMSVALYTLIKYYETDCVMCHAWISFSVRLYISKTIYLKAKLCDRPIKKPDFWYAIHRNKVNIIHFSLYWTRDFVFTKLWKYSIRYQFCFWQLTLHKKKYTSNSIKSICFQSMIHFISFHECLTDYDLCL